MAINSATGSISWTPATSGDYDVMVKISDGELIDVQSFSITVSDTTTRIISLSGDTTFGDVYINESATTILKISNTGNSTLHVTGITYPSGFSGSWTGDISAGSFHDITVTFAPTQMETYGGTLTVSSNKTSGTNTKSVSGTGTQIATTIIVTSPNGGETWNVGETRNITWTVSGDISHIDHFILNYGTNGICNQYYIDTTSSASRSYSWIIPNTPSTQCKIGVWAMDASDNCLAFDDSDGLFTIFQSPSTNISPEAEKILGEWTAIMPASISNIIIQIEDNQFLIRVWKAGYYNDQTVYYDWGEQVVEISDFSDGILELNWATYSEWSCSQKIEILANGVLKIFSTENNYAENVIITYTDYFYNPEADNSFIPDISGVGLYQDDSEFVNLVYQLDSPEKICQYMENNINYKALSGPHSPYQTYLSKEGDCGDYAVFASAIANFHGYECFYIIMNWTCGACHAITVYNMGGYYTYSSNYLYFDQYFNSIEECVNHCASTYIGYIEGTLSSYEVFDWDFYYYRNISIR